MEFLTRSQAAEQLGVHERKIDRYRTQGVAISNGNLLYLQSLSTGDKGNGPVRIPRHTMDGMDERYMGFEDFLLALVRRNEQN